MLSKPVRAVALMATLVALVVAPGSMSAIHAGQADPGTIASSYLAANAGDLGVAAADVAQLEVTSSVRSAHNGVTHINVNQLFQGRQVFGGHATVSIDDAGRVIFASGSLVAGLAAAPSGSARLGATDAVAAAAEALDLGKADDARVVSTGGGETVIESAVSAEPIPARLGWQPTANGLRLAWQVTIDAASESDHWNAAIDAESGALLDADNWTDHDDLRDLQSTLTRSASPARSFAAASSASPPFVTPYQAIDGSSYRVYAIPAESPNDTGRTLVENPADNRFSPFGWHDTNGAPGPEFTITRGNNVHAYLDQDNNNAPDFGGNPDGGPTLTFDFIADLNEHAQNYRDAVVTNLFYWNNVIHDVMANFGFTEPFDNFQAINYGGGGNGDYVRAEAADGGGTNNANFNTPAAGGTPRMQMYLWPGSSPQNEVVVAGVGGFGSSWARFGPAPSVAGTSGPLFDAGNGCTAANYAGMPAGAIAIAVGGNSGCQNIDKARQADTAGAAAIVITHNTTAAAPILTGSQVAAPPTIPAASVTQADGNAIRAAVPADATVRKHPNHRGIRDGDFENGIIIHEYGHGISNRLTGGPGINCLSGNEQAGEGWSDYYAITMLLDPGLDDPDGPRGMGPYALFQDDRQGNGIRPRPYSRNMEIQPFTYDSIKTGGWLVNAQGTAGTSLALPHGLGHGWAALLWDLNWELIDKYGFNPNIYGTWNSGGNNRSLQYVTDGLKLQGCGPGLVVAARAITAAAQALGGEDVCTTWAVFARRGFGYSAVQGTTNRDDNTEAFDTHPDCRRGFISHPASYGTLNPVDAGDAVPVRFSDPALSGLDIFAKHNPYSRQVDCTTLNPVQLDPPRLTPKAYPVPTKTPGASKLTRNAVGVYHYNWKTDEAWAGTCRELVLTRKDGKQHRAFFSFS
jgi:extracellular elastinolytic metalloproteinase